MKQLKFLIAKKATYKKLKQFNIPTPEYAIIKKPSLLDIEAGKMLKKFKEIVIKPAISRGGRNVFIVSSKTKGLKIYDNRREIKTDLNNFKKKILKEI